MNNHKGIKALFITGAFVGFGLLLYALWPSIDRAFSRGWDAVFPPPVPPDLVGVWENEEQLIDAGPGEVFLIIHPDGVVGIDYDHTKYLWGLDRFHLRVDGENAIFWVDHPANEERKTFPIRIEHRDGRLTIRDFFPEALKFRRVSSP